MVQLVISNKPPQRYRMQVDTETISSEAGRIEKRQERRGGDHGGRRPKLGDTKILIIVPDRELNWFKETTGDGGKGRGRVSAFIRSLMTAAANLGLSMADWEAIACSPSRFRDAINAELRKPE